MNQQTKTEIKISFKTNHYSEKDKEKQIANVKEKIRNALYLLTDDLTIEV